MLSHSPVVQIAVTLHPGVKQLFSQRLLLRLEHVALRRHRRQPRLQARLPRGQLIDPELEPPDLAFEVCVVLFQVLVFVFELLQLLDVGLCLSFEVFPEHFVLPSEACGYVASSST